MKRCPCCEEIKSIDEFPRNRRTKSGIANYCKVCHNAKGHESRERGGGARKYHLWRRYGLTLEAYEAMLTQQGYVCAVCGVGEPAHVDHDHASGLVRGLLCFGCNGGLGHFRDDPNVLRKAAEYVESARRRTDLPQVEPQRRRG